MLPELPADLKKKISETIWYNSDHKQYTSKEVLRSTSPECYCWQSGWCSSLMLSPRAAIFRQKYNHASKKKKDCGWAFWHRYYSYQGSVKAFQLSNKSLIILLLKNFIFPTFLAGRLLFIFHVCAPCTFCTCLIRSDSLSHTYISYQRTFKIVQNKLWLFQASAPESVNLECPQNRQPCAALVPAGFAGCMSSSNLQFLLSLSLLPSASSCKF